MATVDRRRFQRGSGVYTCRSCSRKTRSTGTGDSEHVRLCGLCYDLAGIENEISDNGTTPQLDAEVRVLRQMIVMKGGVLS